MAEMPYERYPIGGHPRSSQERDCRRCQHAGSDPDGGFCGHPKSLEESAGFGRSWTAFRREGSPCGPKGELWEQMSEERMKALGITP